MSEGIPDGFSVDVGDLNMDGALDLFIIGDNHWTVFGNGDGTFTNWQIILHTDIWNGDIRLGDLDGDGDLDAFISTARSQAYHQVLLNNGDGTFEEKAQPNIPSHPNRGAIDLADFDNDGDLDAVTWNHVWINDGLALFTLGQELTTFGDPLFVDIDNDGDLDICQAHNDFHVQINDGMGHFSQHITIEMQLNSPAGGIYFDLGDLDNDGDMDAVVVGGDWLFQLENDGSGTFSASSWRPYGVNRNVSGIHLVDLDEDGDLDMMAGARRYFGHEKSKIFWNVDQSFIPGTQEFPPVLRVFGMKLRNCYLDEIEVQIPRWPGQSIQELIPFTNNQCTE